MGTENIDNIVKNANLFMLAINPLFDSVNYT